MNRLRIVLLFLCLLGISFLFSSCFETVEEINLNSDGSGTMVLTLNMSQSKTKVASLMKMQSVNGHKIPSQLEISQEMNASEAALRSIKGISNVHSTVDFSNYIAVFKFDFADVALINLAMQKILTKYKIMAHNATRYYYNKSTKTFTKAYMSNASTLTAYQKLKADEKDIFKKATYTSIYRFSTPVEERTNAQSAVSKSGTAVMQRANILGIIQSTTNISNSIKLQ